MWTIIVIFGKNMIHGKIAKILAIALQLALRANEAQGQLLYFLNFSIIRKI